MDEVKIISLPEERWKEYKNLRIQAVTQDPPAFGTTDEEELGQPDTRWINRLKSGAEKKMIFAELNGKLIGMVCVYVESLNKIRHVAHLFSFYVDPQVRGKGVGIKLMDAALSHFSSLGYITKIKLEVTVTQEPAINLYKKYGFEVVGIEKNELMIGGVYFDQYLMVKFV